MSPQVTFSCRGVKLHDFRFQSHVSFWRDPGSSVLHKDVDGEKSTFELGGNEYYISRTPVTIREDRGNGGFVCDVGVASTQVIDLSVGT